MTWRQYKAEWPKRKRLAPWRPDFEHCFGQSQGHTLGPTMGKRQEHRQAWGSLRSDIGHRAPLTLKAVFSSPGRGVHREVWCEVLL